MSVSFDKVSCNQKDGTLAGSWDDATLTVGMVDTVITDCVGDGDELAVGWDWDTNPDSSHSTVRCLPHTEEINSVIFLIVTATNLA